MNIAWLIEIVFLWMNLVTKNIPYDVLLFGYEGPPHVWGEKRMWINMKWISIEKNTKFSVVGSYWMSHHSMQAHSPREWKSKYVFHFKSEVFSARNETTENFPQMKVLPLGIRCEGRIIYHSRDKNSSHNVGWVTSRTTTYAMLHIP